LTFAPVMLLWPGLAIALAVLGFNLPLGVSGGRGGHLTS